MSQTCPFCKTALPPAATMCSNCGARYGYDPNHTVHPLVRFGFYAAFALMAAEAMRIMLAPEIGYLAAVAFAGLLFAGYRKRTRKHWWRRA
jgi:hypothetical protein